MSDLDPDVRAFYDRHCAVPGGVVVAHVYDDDGDEIQTGVFSTIDAARSWVDGFSGGSALFVPYVVDAPEFGNVQRSGLN